MYSPAPLVPGLPVEPAVRSRGTASRMVPRKRAVDGRRMKRLIARDLSSNPIDFRIDSRIDLSPVLVKLASEKRSFCSHAARRDNDLDGSQQDREVEPERPVGHVGQLVAQLVLRRGVVVAVDLGEAGEAGSEGEALGVA